MRRKLLGFLCVLGATVIFLVSCQTDGEESRAVVTVAAINENVPVFSDVLEQGDSVRRDNGQFVIWDDYIKEDHVSVLFYNRPYNPLAFTEPGRPFGEYLVTRYRVEWERLDGGSPTPPTYNGVTSVSVPTGEFVEAFVVLVPFEVKTMPFLTALQYSSSEILCHAHFTFWGHEVGTDRETLFRASISVNFADLLVKSERDY